MLIAYGVWYKDPEAPGLVTVMFDGKLAQRLADESWEFIKNNPYDTDRIIAELNAVNGKSDAEIDAVMAAHDQEAKAWRSNIPLARYEPDYLYEMFVSDGFGVHPFPVHGVPQFDYLALRNAVAHDAWTQKQLRETGDSHVLSETEMHRRVSSFERALAFLTRRR